MKPKPTKRIQIARALFVPIVADGALGGPPSDGRLVPVLIVDIDGRSELKELLRVHAHEQLGAVVSQWGASSDDPNQVFLTIDFESPMTVCFAFKFDIDTQAILVEMILRSRALYFQAGSTGDLLSETLEEPRVFVEIPDMGFDPVWDHFATTRMARVFRQRIVGCSKAKSRELARRFVDDMRHHASLRLG